MTSEELGAWVQRSCEAQGVAVFVSDPVTIDEVVTLLRAGVTARKGAQRPSTGAASRSDSPGGTDAVGIELAAGAFGLVDDGVVEDGFHDGGLAGEVEG